MVTEDIAVKSERPAEKQNELFAEVASPANWVMTADNLHSQAEALHRQRHASRVTQIRANKAIERPESNRATFLLGAFALENLIKAFLVFENPQWISNGRLSGNLKSHELTALAQQSGLLPSKRQFDAVLAEFEDGIDSWARYPCALTVFATREEGVLREEVWHDYLKTMRAYGEALLPRLAHGWKGPHGQFFQFETDGLSFCNIVTKVKRTSAST